jgi:hypothetical protein
MGKCTLYKVHVIGDFLKDIFMAIGNFLQYFYAHNRHYRGHWKDYNLESNPWNARENIENKKVFIFEIRILAFA